MFKHLLVPTDGTEFSTTTVQRAIKFASESGAKVTFFYAKPDYSVVFYGEGVLVDPNTPQAFAEQTEQRAAEILAACQAMAVAGGVDCEIKSATGELPYQAIIECADQSACDLIFMASHGRRGLSALLLGSETQKVLTHSKIPVLVYRS
ncbi:MAG: universal stress protein [Rhodocyclaceae bacterium]|nr:universal stress protein [Rhodocyclaceae bacterium]